MSKVVRKRWREKRRLECCIEMGREGEMDSAPLRWKDGEFGVTVLEHHRDTVGVRDGLAVLEGQRGHDQLTGSEQQFLTFEIVNFDALVVEPLVVEDLADLRAEGARDELVEPELHRWVCSRSQSRALTLPSPGDRGNSRAPSAKACEPSWSRS